MPKGQLTTEQRLKQNVARLKTINAKLRVRDTEREAVVVELRAQIDTLKIQMVELQTMVFGKNRRPPTGTSGPESNVPLAPKSPRTKNSYRRPLPPASAITTTTQCPVSRCQCGGELVDITTSDRYVEDIPLPGLTPGYRSKLVT